MFTDEEGFLNDLKRLDRALEDPTTQNLLDVVVVLRRLLIDGDRMTDRLKKRRQLRITYKMRNLPRLNSPTLPGMKMILDFTYDPRKQLPFPIISKDLKSFLKTPIMQLESQEWLSVHGLLNYLAQVAGAVHKDKSAKTRQHAQVSAAAAFSPISFNGKDSRDLIISHVEPITYVVRQGLEPLREAIQN